MYFVCPLGAVYEMLFEIMTLDEVVDKLVEPRKRLVSILQNHNTNCRSKHKICKRSQNTLADRMSVKELNN